MTTLYLIRGVPGSGKSSFAKQLADATLVHRVLEADRFFLGLDGKYLFDVSKLSLAHAWCQSETRFALSVGQSVAVSNTSTTEKEVAIYQNIAEETGAKFVSIVMENRHNGINVHNVPDDKLAQMRERFTLCL